MQRAYLQCGVSPRTVELIEAHGTGTRAGDRAEMKAVEKVFFDATAGEVARSGPWCAIGSVKSMIGHTQAASGIAGLIKATLALHHKILPPTLNVTTPNLQVDWNASPCYINTTARPWSGGDDEVRAHPRRAAVSAFGFGGVNAHVILEEYSTSLSQQQGFIAPSLVRPVRSAMMKLSLKFPALSARSLAGLQLTPRPASHRSKPSPNLESEQVSSLQSLPLSRHSRPVEILAKGQQRNFVRSSIDLRQSPAVMPVQQASTDPQGRSAVLRSFIQFMSAAHQNLLGVQENVMLAYIDESAVSADSPPDVKTTTNQIV